MFMSVRKFNLNHNWMVVLLLTAFGVFASTSSNAGNQDNFTAMKTELCYVQKYLAGNLCSKTAAVPAKRMVFH